MRYVRISCLALFFVPLIAAAQQPPPAPQEFGKLEEAVRDMAGEVQQFIANRREAGNAVQVSTFQGPGGTSSGVNVVRVLKGQLAAKGIKTIDAGGFNVSGRVSSVPSGDQMVTVIEAVIANSLNTPELTLRRRIVTDQVELQAFLGATVDLSQAAQRPVGQSTPAGARPAGELPLEDRGALIQLTQSLQQPQAAVVKEGPPGPGGAATNVVHNVLKVSEQSPYGLEILRYGPRGELLPCEIFLEPTPGGGQLGFIRLGPQEAFAVRIRNDSPRPVGADLRLDGINSFAFSRNEHYRRLGRMMIAPGGGTVAGWHDWADHSFRFTIVSYGESAAAKLGATEGIGTISVIFFNLPDKPPMGVPPQQAVGFGDSIRVPYREAFTHFGNIVGAITLRYRRPEPPKDLPPGP